MDLKHGSLLALLCLVAMPAAAQEAAPAETDVPAASEVAGSGEGAAAATGTRIRLFGQNGVGMVMYTDTVCTRKYASKIEASGTLGSAFGSLFGSVKNESLGIPETATTQSLKQRGKLGSKAYYREYALVPGKPVVLQGGMSAPTGWRCERQITSSFTPEAGKDYEAALDLDFSDGVCTLKVNEVAADGALTKLDVVPASKTCPETGAAQD